MSLDLIYCPMLDVINSGVSETSSEFLVVFESCALLDGTDVFMIDMQRICAEM